MALLIGIIEAIIKVAAGIASMTATKKDDAIVEMIDKGFSAIRKYSMIYQIS